MKKIIVTGHGHFATGLQNAVELLAGKNEDVFFVDFLESDSDVILKEKLEKVAHENADSDILFFCDLVGGTPYKMAATIAFENERYEVVAGCNIGSLIEILFTKESYEISELAQKIISISHSATGYFEKRITKKEEEITDGI
ncbi:PTS fructose transporter subunit IIA [Bacillus sp. FJAT-49736]|uniref:PTS sugar transporter subunit IIA domain-containing protein n=1 Tax=Bacillus sp. FJAT-49736 TaxID=2833582 RepID=UPI001BC91BB1|nr:PTS fructose transporter subunit IIA [Bacillus sp. FJAT-49736]MBS4174201.1 PTS fructose transporter subunit IIA [Bacillus sp. FJAT-49736]